jgi:photosystem II stability/assembly factor-like uncharacterized protein
VNGEPGVVAVTALLTSPSGLWALANGSLFHSDGSAAAWTKIDVSPLPSAILCIASDSSGRIFAGLSAPSALWQYRPDSSTWKRSAIGLEYKTVTNIAVASQSLVYVGTAGWGVFRSTDGGASWNPPGGGLPSGDITLLHITLGERLFAGTPNQGLYSSSDSGSTWIPTPTGSGNQPLFAIATGPLGMIFLSTASGLFRSSDRGSSWIQAFPAQTGYDFRSFLPAWSGILYGGTGSGVRVSYDNGQTWVDQSEGLAGTEVHALLALPDSRIIAGTEHGLFTSKYPAVLIEY